MIFVRLKITDLQEFNNLSKPNLLIWEQATTSPKVQ